MLVCSAILYFTLREEGLPKVEPRRPETPTKALNDYNLNCAEAGGVAVLNVYGNPLCLSRSKNWSVVECLSGCGADKEGWTR